MLGVFDLVDDVLMSPPFDTHMRTRIPEVGTTANAIMFTDTDRLLVTSIFAC